MKKAIKFFLIAVIFFCVFQICAGEFNRVEALEVEEAVTNDIEEMKAQCQEKVVTPTITPKATSTPEPTETPVAVTTIPEVLGEIVVTPTEELTPTTTPTPTVTLTPVFDINWMEEMLATKISDYQGKGLSEEKAYKDLEAVGSVEVGSVSAALRYGTKYKSNIKKAAGIANFSTDDRLYVLGHNNENGTIFSNLQYVEVGEQGTLTLYNKERGILQEYKFEVVFAKRYTINEYEAENYIVLTDNPDYQEEYDLVLATCKHLSKTDKGRYVLLCRIIEE